MALLLSHWHCILPILAIVAAVFLMRGKPEKKKDDRPEQTMQP